MNDEPSERYDHNANNVTGSNPIDWENDLVPIQLWKEQYDEIVRLRGEIDKFGPGYWEIQRERNRLLDDVKDLEDCRELLSRLGQLCGCDHVDEISNGRARDIIHELRVALLPFSARHATMHKYYDSDSGHVPESVTVPRAWLAEAYRVLKEGLAND